MNQFTQTKKLIFIGLMLMCLAQLAVPLWMVLSKENIEKQGIVYNFELRGVDPNDPFRGKYIILRPLETQGPCMAEDSLYNSGTRYATFKNDKNNLAKIDQLYKDPPNQEAYLEVQARRVRSKKDSSTMSITYPFERYYMNEFKAARAERMTTATTRDSSSIAYAEVAIYKGESFVKGVKIDGKAIEELLAINREE